MVEQFVFCSKYTRFEVVLVPLDDATIVITRCLLQSIKKSELQKSKYEAQERGLELQLVREIKANEALRVKG